MFKRIAGIGLIVLLAGTMIGGTVYILLRSGTGSAEGHQTQAGRGGTGEAAGNPGFGRDMAETGRWASGQGRGSQPGGRNGGLDREVAVSAVGVERPADWRGQTALESQAAELAEDLDTVVGTVVEAEEELLLQTADGEVVVNLGPAWYRENQGYTIQLGDQMRVVGFYEDGTLEAMRIENLSTGGALVLRDEGGYPLWSGRGRRGF